jgi:transcriptional regulator
VYTPRFNQLDDPDSIRAMVHGVGAAELVTVAADGYPAATRLPVIWDEDEGRLVFHLARANPQWPDVPTDTDVPALAVVSDAEAYVSPAWYATKAEHGRVVPTWNYSAVQFSGRLRRYDDPEWLLEAVTRLTELHESTRPEPWAVTDAPATYVDKQLRAIVGLELTIERVEGKAKLSQNRSEDDRAGVVRGLRTEGGRREAAVADQMDALQR